MFSKNKEKLLQIDLFNFFKDYLNCWALYDLGKLVSYLLQNIDEKNDIYNIEKLSYILKIIYSMEKFVCLLII